MQIYHNPRCSKSRQALALCQERDVDLEVVEYLKEKPTRKALETLDLLVERPEFLQRPILVDGERVSVARSPEAVAEFLDAQNRGK